MNKLHNSNDFAIHHRQSSLISESCELLLQIHYNVRLEGITMIESRRMGWAGHVARWGEEGRWEVQRERDY
jgi:hypothetical protein